MYGYKYCVREYCLICCAKKTTCAGCHRKPSHARLVETNDQLKRVQQGMASGRAVSNATPERSKVSGLRRALYSKLTKNVITIILIAKKRTR